MLTSDKGYTIVELLIAMAIVGIVLTGIYDLVISSSRILSCAECHRGNAGRWPGGHGLHGSGAEAGIRQSNDITPLPPQTTIRSASIVWRIRAIPQVEIALQHSTTPENPGSLATLLLPATSTFTVRIISGTGTGQVRTISNNSSTQLTLSQAWGTIPDTTSVYVITSNKGFTRTSASDNVLRYRIGATGANNPLAENITSHSFSQPSP